MRFLSLFAVLTLCASSLSAQGTVHHVLDVKLEPESHRLTVIDTITLPKDLREIGVEFSLSDVLKISKSSASLKRSAGEGGLATYTWSVAPENGELVLEYSGDFDFGLSEKGEEYARSFQESRGIVGPEGVYLHGGSGWVASFGDEMITFTVDVEAPEDWHVISQGGGDSQISPGKAHWESGGALEQVYLVGGALKRFSDVAGAIESLVYLHEPDEALSAKYLEVTAQYIEMYRGLIGPYPYEKFALVENFWETGYGMPSFTLLGPQVVRLPFILHSSYPHEILHNWWGNSVFVDYETGNWCEGLTAYMADHLIQEQRGKGAHYRRSTLQKYRDYVKEGRDFPLNEFRSRHSASTEAVGYGKASMTFHMLRRHLGDEHFVRGVQRFYRDNRGKRASFDDFRVAMEGVSGEKLESFFTQWVDGLGAPQLVVSQVSVEEKDGSYVLTGGLGQVQAEEPFALEIPIRVLTAQGDREFMVASHGRLKTFRLEVDAEPIGLEVDPLFDLFRVLDPFETPPSIGQIFGEPQVLAVLPVDETEANLYRELVQSWNANEHVVSFVSETEIQELPADAPVWILGRENRFVAALLGSLTSASAGAASATLAGEPVPFADHSLVVVARHPANVERAIGWIVLDPEVALEGLARKLPHYGKYSYLAFEGEEPTNVVKGQWSAEGSPLVVQLGDQPITPVKDTRAALADTPPVFSSARLKAHVDWLADPARKGRGLGTPELEESAEYIAAAFAEVGLEPGGDNHTWYQEFTVEKGPNGKPVTTKNVVGILRGRRADWKEQSLVLGAHYDHLGLGWPDARAGNEGQIHPGADDNASGVAVLIELARQIVAGGGGSRNLVVVAFSAEECGLLGSKHYVDSPRFPLGEIRGMINMDAVGRLGEGSISIHAAGTADEWQHIFRGAGFVTGIANKIVPQMFEGSDQLSFIEKGVPAVQIFTGANADYHNTSDTADKVSGGDLVKVATFVREGVAYMLEREELLTSKLDGAKAVAPSGSAAKGGRRVSFGSFPDFEFEGDGMRLDGVIPGSPAALAGFQGGDILILVDKTEISSLRDFSDCLKTYKPGQTVTAVVLRDGEEVTAKVTLVAR